MNSEWRLLQSHPAWPAAQRVIARLEGAGHRALLAGGCVRDVLLGRSPQDLDIATSAPPETVIGLFEKTVPVGKSFGVVRVLEGDQEFEVATFRRDVGSADGRRPEAVQYSDEKEDALRRDFTVNALFLDVSGGQILDYVNGRADLAARVLRTVGDPRQRFSEDHLRLLRAVRFAAQLGFRIDPSTWTALTEGAAWVASVSRERVRDEMVKLLGCGPGRAGLNQLIRSGLHDVLFPSLSIWHDSLLNSADRLLLTKGTDPVEVFLRWLAPLSGEGGSSAVESVMGSLRLSRSQESDLRLGLRVLGDGEAFWRWPSGRQILAYDQPVVRLALRLMVGDGDSRRQDLDSAWRRRGGGGAGLPPRLLRGEDAGGAIQGADLGRLLNASYEAQLEGRFQDHAGALTWMREWLNDQRSEKP